MGSAKVSRQISAEDRNPRKSAKICEHMPYSAREAFKRLRTNVLIALGEKPGQGSHIIGITSAQPSEGKSTISINLAYSLAEQGKKVILLDCDLRRPSIHANMGIDQAPGITEVLDGRKNLGSVLIHYKSTASDTTFDLMVAGELPDNPSEVLGSRNFLQLLEAAGKAYDVVILDLPPVNAVIDAAVVARMTDGLVVVIREKHCPRFVLQDCMEQLRYAKANILGFAVNGSVADKKYYRNKYAYRYGDAYYQQERYGK